MTTPLRCVLLGSESLLIQCGQILEQGGHQIVAVVSRRSSVRRWAAERGIRALPDTTALLAAQDLRPFDYLFSITNLSVLPAEVLALPARAAINFHDGPLPEYAGLNTPVWAILNREQSHGVAWHLMTSQVDRGGILARREFPLSDSESALTLNTKCYEAGIESFEALAAQFGSGSLTPEPQIGPPQKNFRRNDRPAAASTIDWTAPAATTATLIRALDFGTYANPMGSAKAGYGGKLLIVAEATVSGDASRAAPGTIEAIDENAVSVATADSLLKVQRFESLDGQALTPFEAARQFGMKSGSRFDQVTPELRKQLTTITAQVAGHETYWQSRLESLAPAEVPGIERTIPAGPATEIASLDAAMPGGIGSDAAVALVLGFLARLMDRDQFDVSFADPELAGLVAGSEAWFASQVPFRAKVDLAADFHALRAGTALQLKAVRRRQTYATDLVARVPALRAVARNGNPRTAPVSLIVVERLEDAKGVEGSELTIAISRSGGASRWFHDTGRLSRTALLALQGQFHEFARSAIETPARALALLPLITPTERTKVLVEWNATAGPWRTDACVHRLIEEQAARTPDATAVIFGDQSLSYRELDRRANQLARRLASLGVGPDVLVGLAVERSVELLVGLLAIQKAGGAYVPLDPTYPKDRLAWMIEDARAPVLLTLSHLREDLPRHRAIEICLDTDWPAISTQSDEPFDGGALPENLAYVIYTSGSTGKPKGVMVEHRNVVNFFAGMDRRIGGDEPGTWLAVTSTSFDISVLELCWTLARGFRVVIAPDLDRNAAASQSPHAGRPIDFSLFYFSSDESEGVTDKYRLLIEGAKFGDQHGFAAVWTPERHFHAFGGLYPNPAVTSAAIATITDRIKIRAGSVVLPLHHPIRVAEEWSLVDNLSRGRVGISFAAGWQPNDFLLRPENFKNNKQVMLDGIDTVRRLWRGEAMSFPGATGEPVEVRILPRPVQPELPFWLTSAGNPETFAAAGRIGAFVLTHLLGQSVDELIDKLAAYRKAWKEAGHQGEGHVTLMLHAFVGTDPDAVREKVRQPLIEYLRSSVSLIKQYAWSFPAFKKRPGMDTSGGSVDLQSLNDEEMTALLEHSFGRYYETSGLFGTPESCLVMVDRLKEIGVDEIACLIDFGVDSASVLEHLDDLNQLRRLATPRRGSASETSLGELMVQHGVTHLQCTPSMARMLLADDRARSAMGGLRRMMVGGEAFPASIAKDLTSLVGGEVMNMYGPTETTIWSSVFRVRGEEDPVPLGPPLLNQEIYILDSRQQPVPVGISGEIVIGGAGVVRGYLHRPDLTAERFIPHPIRGAGGGAVYRTGDLARFRPDGTIEFLGRLDHQVKVRGFRIELGEIESAILSVPDVKETVVAAREDLPGDLRLVAYVVPARPGAVRTVALREHLRDRLPEYMVPGHFVMLDALPLTPNGKLDRRALPAPELEAIAGATVPFEPPAGDLEETIATIWQEVLNLPRVGTRDNFFDLGGHSLLAVQAHRRLREVLQRELSITDIFRFPTIHSLSTYLSAGSDGAAAQQGLTRAEERRAARQQRRAPRPRE